MQRNKDLESWEIFCTVAENGSISSATYKYDMDAAYVSRVLRSLEQSLGNITLLDRSARPLRLTENGHKALKYAREMLNSHRALIESLDSDPSAMKGMLRIGMPPALLQHFLIPFILEFNEAYPEIKLEISEYAGRPPVCFETPQGRLDIICGYGEDTSKANLHQIYYGRAPMIPVASKQYLKQNGIPEKPSDLINHTGVIFDPSSRSPVRVLIKDGKVEELRWKKTIHFSSALPATYAAISGAGIHPGIPALICSKEIILGQLIPILQGWRPPEDKLYLYVSNEARKLKRAQVFIEHYLNFMKGVHEVCESSLRPFVGEIHINL